MKNIKNFIDLWNKYKCILTKSQKKWGILVLVMTLFGAVFETLGVSIVLPLVQVMIDVDSLRKYTTVIKLVHFFGFEFNKGLVWLIGYLVIAIYLLKNIYLFFLSYIRVKYSCKIQRELSIEMMETYMGRGYLFFVNITTGELLRGMQGSIGNVYEGLYQLLRIFAEVFTVVCICIFIMITDWTMAACVVLLAGICLLFVLFVFKKWTKISGEIIFKYDSLINKTLLQAFQGIKEVLVLHSQSFFIRTYEKQYIKRQKGIIGKTVSTESPAYLIEGICVIGMIIAVCMKTRNISDTTVLIPQLAAFAVAAFRIMPSLGRISSYFNVFMTCIPGINDAYENFLNIRNENGNIRIKDKGNLQTEAKRKYDWQEIEVKNISWRYPSAQKWILKNVSITIEKGKSIAFVGVSGAGKTTFADIILGLFEPCEGRICVDNLNIKEVLEKYNNFISFVPQNVYLLDDSVRNNVAFGISEKEIDDRKVWRSLEQACLKEFIEDQEEKLDMKIGEKGIKLSGGQRQRIAIARALYNDPDILVLDEATSALDTETETAIMESINSLHGKKTLIIIAHRLTTIQNCDVIYRIEDGKAMQCRYDEL